MNKERRPGTGAFNSIKSALSAAIGVQSSTNRERDFEQGSPLQFVIAGLVVTLMFIGIMIFAVQWMIASNS